LEWLKDSDFEVPKCIVCSEEFGDSPTVRLTCFHILHPACLEHYASQFPAHTAQAGYGCPKCTKPIIPASTDQTDLANTLRDVLATQEWAKSFLVDPERDSNSMFKNLPRQPESGLCPEPGKGHAGNPGDSAPGRIPFGFGNTVSRKVAVDRDDSSDYGIDSDEAENKYRRRGMMQLLVALGLVTPGQGGHILNSKRLVIVFLAFSLILLFWVLFKSASLSEEDPA